MGVHSKPSRVRLAQASAGAAVPTLAGVAAICLSPQAAAAATQPTASTPGATTAPAAATASGPAAAARHVPEAYRPGPGTATRLLAARGSRHKAAPAATTYTVRAGDSLSAIAGRVYHSSAAWPVLYWDNHSQIRWANIITPGQVLKVPAKPGAIPAPPAQLGPGPAYIPRHATPAPAAAAAEVPDAAPAPATVAAAPAAAASWSGIYPGGAFGACVVARESGGNAQIWNPSGHWGLYQFSYSTWVAYGGNPADFGHAGAAVQNAVFATALARGGQSNWSPYDGC